jgi:hypothetical protein
MKSVTFFSVGAVCAILAGVARVVLIVAPGKSISHPALETIYLAIDLAILLALLALIMRLGNRLQLWGVVGVMMAITGLLVIRTGERSLFGIAAYTSGAALLAIGMAVTTLPFIRVQGLGRISAILFLMSPLTAIIASVAKMGAAGFAIASAFFGLALIAAGAMLIFERDSIGNDVALSAVKGSPSSKIARAGV